MKRLDQFILKSFIGPFIAVLFVVVFILVMQFLWLYIDELVGKGLGLKVILEFLGWGACTILPLSMPLAVLLSSMMTIGTLGENNELLAMKAAGVSLGRVLIPLGGVAVIISILAFFVGNNLIPVAYNKIYTLRDDILKTKSEIKIPEKTFYDGIDGYILRVENRDDETGVMHDVVVYDHTNSSENENITIAKRAKMDISEDKSYLIFIMEDGTAYSEENKVTFKDTSRAVTKIEFKRQELLVKLENHSFQKSDEGRFGNEIKSMRLGDLQLRSDTLKNELANLKDSHVKQIYENTVIRSASQLSPEYNGNARSTIDYDKKFKELDPDAKVKILKAAKNRSNEYVSALTNLGVETYRNNFFIRHIDVEIFKKFAGALACFIFFFIGAPMGAIIRKGGLGVSAIISVLFFVFYWVIDISGTKLANDGSMGAFNGVFISSYILMPIGAFLTWQVVNDSSINILSPVVGFFKEIKKKIRDFFKKTRIVYMGTPEFAVAPLDKLVKNGCKIVGVVTVADKPAGRGQKVIESPVKKYAVEHNIPVLQPLKLKDPEFLESLRALKADLFVVVAFRMLPKEVWDMPPMGTFNLHAALLPQYRGAAPINWAIINGEQFSGVTTFKINEGIDTGHIMFREQVRVPASWNAGDLHDNLMGVGSELVLQTVQAMIEGEVELRLQKSFIQGTEVIHEAPKISDELCNIDFNDKAERIHNLVRGLSPYPGAFTTIVKDSEEALRLKIYASEVIEIEKGIKPGTIISDGKNLLAIACEGDKALKVLDLQLSGKKRMSVDAFLRGFRNPCDYSIIPGTSKSVLDSVK
ncbi:MAG: methionyl-tRNA formyltransferase [Bacteroidales bacterium]|nr:methionyl-tRNA formyltransferase [Bacteroidales bacterium]